MGRKKAQEQKQKEQVEHACILLILCLCNSFITNLPTNNNVLFLNQSGWYIENTVFQKQFKTKSENVYE